MKNQFIDDFSTINDGREFGRTNGEIYPKEVELKPEYHNTHSSFLILILV